MRVKRARERDSDPFVAHLGSHVTVFAARTAAAATPRARVPSWSVLRLRYRGRPHALVDETCGSFAAWFKPQ